MEFNVLKNALIAAAEAASLKEYEIYYMETAESSATGFRGELKGISGSRSGGICFRCIVNGRMGYASTELLEEGEMAELVSRAVTAASMIENDDRVFIWGGSPAYRAPEPAAEMAEVNTLSTAALTLLDCAMKADARVTDSSESTAVTEETTIHLVNSTGLSLSNHVSVTGAVVEVIVGEGEEKQVAYDIAKSLDEESLRTLAAKTVEEACAMLGAGEIETGKYNIVFSPKQARNILSTFSPVFSAKNAQQGLSLLAGKEGETIAAPCVTVSDDPASPLAIAHTHFDAEGVATARKNVIEGGVLKTLLYNLTTAEKAGVTTTANASKGSYASPVGISPYCFCIEAGELSFDQLLARAGDGIYVTEMKGFHAGADPVTGDFSIECAGFRIEGGKIGAPLKSFTVAGNFFGWLKEIEALSDEVEVGFSGGFTCFGAPAVFVPGMSVAGK